MRKAISIIIAAVITLVVATPAHAYLHIGNATTECATRSWSSADASSRRTWGVGTAHGSAFSNNYGRYSDSHVWVDVGWMTNDDWHNIFTYCDVSGSDANPVVNSVGVHY